MRELGPRELIEVPLDEIAELMRRLQAAGHTGDLKRAVLDTYGLMRMTSRAEQYLTTAEELLDDDHRRRRPAPSASGSPTRSCARSLDADPLTSSPTTSSTGPRSASSSR